MKPYVLHYSETINIRKFLGDQINRSEFRPSDSGSTWVTESIEPADDDEIYFKCDSTELTFVRESDDNDEIGFMTDSTVMTKSIEPSDEDEIF